METSELKNLIKAIGGPTLVAERCGVSHSAVCHWEEVPKEHCPVLETMARERRIVREDGSPYTCEVLRPDLADRFAMIRGVPATNTVVPRD